MFVLFFFFNGTAPPEIFPFFPTRRSSDLGRTQAGVGDSGRFAAGLARAVASPAQAEAPGAGHVHAATGQPVAVGQDRKSTRLNSSHGYISYAVFCLKKKKTTISLYVVSSL